MNKGTAFKWIDEINSGKYERAYGAMRISESCFDPVGILANFFDPLGWKINKIGFYEWHGEINYLPDDWLKRGKIKTKEFEFNSTNLYDMNDHGIVYLDDIIKMRVKREWMNFEFNIINIIIRNNYQQF